MSAPIAACRNHADRAAIGVCVRCRARICAECSTKVDGINRCVSCLAALAPAPGSARPAARPARAGRSALAAALLATAASLLAWGLLEIALPG